MQNSPVDPGTKADEVSLPGERGGFNEEEKTGGEWIPGFGQTDSKGGGKGGFKKDGGVNESDENTAAGGNNG